MHSYVAMTLTVLRYIAYPFWKLLQWIYYLLKPLRYLLYILSAPFIYIVHFLGKALYLPVVFLAKLEVRNLDGAIDNGTEGTPIPRRTTRCRKGLSNDSLLRNFGRFH